MRETFRRVAVTRVGRPGDPTSEDRAAVEEPLEVRLHGRPFAVIMRTPGADRALAAGFLHAEGIVGGADDIGAVEHCRHPDFPDAHNVVDVYLVGEAARRWPELLERRRNVVATSACGVCGRTSIEELRSRAQPLPRDWAVPASALAALPAALAARQRGFAETGGLHGAGLFTTDGRCLQFAEDVGRHNTVDKVIGAMLLAERLPADRAILVVSGRTSFEIVQKAWLAGIRIVSAISAPSSLAIDLASTGGVTLLGFARDRGFNVYTHPDRIGAV